MSDVVKSCDAVLKIGDRVRKKFYPRWYGVVVGVVQTQESTRYRVDWGENVQRWCRWGWYFESEVDRVDQRK